MATLIRMGSLYLGGYPSGLGTEYQSGQSIEIGKSVLGKEISWVVANGMLVANRCILTKVSWMDLNDNEPLTSGTPPWMLPGRTMTSGIGKIRIFGVERFPK